MLKTARNFPRNFCGHFFILSFFSCAIIGAAPVLAAPESEGAQTKNGTQKPKLKWPLDCTVFEDCFIKHYPDLRAGSHRAHPMDYQCGRRTKPGFDGTSIVFQDHNTTQNKIVQAMAPGRVMFRRDGASDRRRRGASGRDVCGHYVQIRHSSTYSSKYCHLREGTLEVNVGDVVKAGAILGQVGASGATKSPKLTVKIFAHGKPVDPFTGRDLTHASECFAKSDKQMWAAEIPYPKAGVMSASFSSGISPSHEIAFDASGVEKLSAKVGTINAWARVFGIKKGDQEKLVIKNPKGEVWHQSQRLHPVSANFWTAMASAKPSNNLEKGVWTGIYTLKRQGETIVEHKLEVQVYE